METDVAVKFEAHEHEIGSLKHRMREQEEQSKLISELVLSVHTLAHDMKQMLEEQREQGQRLNALEQEPANKWRRIGYKAIDVAVGLIMGALVTGLALMIVQKMQ